MGKTVEATYVNGVLQLAENLSLRDHERVRVTVERVVDESTLNPSREAAIARFREGVQRVQGMTNGKYPSRESLHDRD